MTMTKLTTKLVPLIEPYGIEISLRLFGRQGFLPFNRTLWN